MPKNDENSEENKKETRATSNNTFGMGPNAWGRSRPLLVATGLTRGIGRALVDAFGDKVTWLSLQRATASESSLPASVEVLPWDLAAQASPTRSQALVSALKGRPVWGLLHCAGVLGPVGGGVKGFEEALRVNTTSVLDLFETLVNAKAFSPREEDARPPFVLHLSSGAALSPYQGWEAYCTSKAATRMLFRAWSTRFSAKELVVASIAPGTVFTDMMKSVLASSPLDFPAVQKFHDLQAQGGLVAPEVPAQAIAALLFGDSQSYAALHGTLFDLRKGVVAGA
ncbi:MAG: SDR family NAD(P)-dependent oxidoreductase [Silvanigrellales bacterium]|nr:SDR family NAD(P)-dependent oxidoreductase [Silvanigrellales bacterium]